MMSPSLTFPIPLPLCSILPTLHGKALISLAFKFSSKGPKEPVFPASFLNLHRDPWATELRGRGIHNPSSCRVTNVCAIWEWGSLCFTDNFQEILYNNIIYHIPIFWNVMVEIKISLTSEFSVLILMWPLLILFLLMSCLVCKVRKLQYMVSFSLKILCPKVRIYGSAINPSDFNVLNIIQALLNF